MFIPPSSHTETVHDRRRPLPVKVFSRLTGSDIDVSSVSDINPTPLVACGWTMKYYAPPRKMGSKHRLHSTTRQNTPMVEIEIGVLRGQCLDRRIGDRKTLDAEIAAWECQRNADGASIIIAVHRY